MSGSLSTIAFDADDTLWHNEQVFRVTEKRFADLLAEHADPDDISSRLREAEKRNLRYYGYGIKGFTLSMVETALEITENRVPASTIGHILAAGREMHDHPVETLPHARDALEHLSDSYQIILITKGDLFDQERKLAQSGLGDLFNAVEIVSEKDVSTYLRVFAEYGDGPERGMMVGNSLKSDVIPAIAAGGWGVYVPHDLTWALEEDDPPQGTERFHHLDHLGELAALVDTIKY